MTSLFANMRMYSVNGIVAARWRQLAHWVGDRADIDVRMLDHPAPAPIGDLWRRADLGLVQMCGWPFWRSEPRPQLVASPIIDDPRANNQPVYWTDMVVRRDDPAMELEDTFGSRIGWTIEESHSGFNAPRRLLLPHFQRAKASLYSASVGPLVTPMNAIETLLDGKADIVPVDGYFFILLSRHEPRMAARMKTIAFTPSAPVPPFIASPEIARADVQRLRLALTEAHQDPEAKTILNALAIKRFVVPDAETYGLAERWHTEALAANYRAPS